jgi:uncharacterized RDD family membrane protein YckC
MNTAPLPQATSYGATDLDDRLDGVRTRRMLAFVVDYAIVILLIVVAAVVVAFLGLLTFGLAWLVYPILGVAIGLFYVGSTMGEPEQATPGMRMFSLRIERDNGDRIDFFTAVAHMILFWIAHVTLTPLLLVVSLFSSRKRLVQDILLGTVIVRSDR